MDTTAVFVLAILILAAVLLYASVGHAGASAYLAAMALFGFAHTVMKPTALTLNSLVSATSERTLPYARMDCKHTGRIRLSGNSIANAFGKCVFSSSI